MSLEAAHGRTGGLHEGPATHQGSFEKRPSDGQARLGWKSRRKVLFGEKSCPFPLTYVTNMATPWRQRLGRHNSSLQVSPRDRCASLASSTWMVSTVSLQRKESEGQSHHGPML